MIINLVLSMKVVVIKAVFAFHNTVSYFRKRNSNIYIRSQDAKKAFDRINYFPMLLCLIKHDFS